MEFPWKALPAFNALLNASASVLLVAGHRFLKRGNVLAHRRCMLSAFTVSVVFLVSYVVYHSHAGVTRFPGRGLERAAYLTLLGTHTALAATLPPLAIATLFFALRGRFPTHRRLARVTYPIWLYVSTTGVVIYFWLYLVPRGGAAEAAAAALFG